MAVTTFVAISGIIAKKSFIAWIRSITPSGPHATNRSTALANNNKPVPAAKAPTPINAIDTPIA